MEQLSKRNKPWETPLGKILVRYYRNQERMERLRKVETVIRADIQELLDTVQMITNTPKVTAKYGYRAGSGGSGDEDPNMTMMEQLEEATRKAQETIPEKSKRLISIKLRIHEVRRWLAPFTAAFGRLTDEERRILELKYSYRRSNYQISNLMHCSEHRVRCIHRKTIQYLTEWLISKRRRKIVAKNPDECDNIVV